MLKDESQPVLRAQYIYNGLDAPFLDYAIRVLVNVPQVIFEEKNLLKLQQDYFTYMAQSLKFGAWEKSYERCNFIQQIQNFRFKDIGAYTVIPATAYGAQERFYVPIDEHDRSFEKLYELMAEKENIDQAGNQNNKDNLREIIFRGTQLHVHLKKMMDRVVQVNIKEEEVKNLVEYEAATCYMYKLKPGYYTQGPEGHSEYGFQKE
jgi:hypothetical protein